jgi:DNA-binding response OmpR family regulator
MRLLIVEDDQWLAGHLVRGLSEELHTVDLVADGPEALDYTDLLNEGLYDAVILDVLLPGMMGTEVCRHWRGHGVRVPILMLTARRAVDDRVQGLDVGADDYLTKPFAFAELSARIRALGRREEGLRDETLKAGDLTLDPVRHRVERGNRLLDLTPREYRILELFLRHPGQVLTRSQIADRAWDLGADNISNVVDVFIHTLRRKIDGDFEPKLLHTVRGSGYVLHLPTAEVPAVASPALGRP